MNIRSLQPVLPVLAIGLAMCALLLASGEPVRSGAGGTELQGDANCSGEVDAVDALAVLRQLAGFGAAPCEHLADVQCDGDVDAVDALQILRFGAALPVTQEPGCTEIGQPLGPPASSHDLIAEALANDEIDEETALVYDFYAAFNDPRLPEKYSGDDSRVIEINLQSTVAAMWAGLSQQTRDLILPFMRTPAEPDSWYSQQTGRVGSAGIEWDTVPSGSHPVKVWWETRFPDDEARANSFIEALDSKIWEKLTDLMGTEPLPDCGAACPSGGGDERLDIYLVGPSVDAHYTWWNPPEPVTCETTPAYITLLPDASPATVAHEFMHALQFALPYAAGNGCGDLWWWEASATWAEDNVWGEQYNEDQHWLANIFLQNPWLPLEATILEYHDYGAYVFPFYLARVRGKPELVQQIFSKMGSEADVLKAIESEVSGSLGDFGEVWKDFTLKNWNREPVTDYKDLDSLMAGARALTSQIGPGEITLDEVDVEHLAAVYEKFTFSSAVHTVVFKNTLSGVDHAGVMAIKQIGGEWQDPEDWSDDPEKEFCLDRPSEKLTELILIFSNSDAIGRSKLNPSSPPTIEGKREGCSGWEGSASAEATYLRDGNVSIYTAAAQAIRFEQDPDPPPGDVELVFYDLVEGKFHWIASGSPLFCHGTLSGEFDLDVASASGQESVQGSSFVVDGVDDSTYSVDINVADPDAREVWDCLPPYEGLSGEYGWLVDQSLIPHRAEGRNLPLTGTPGSRVAEGSFTLGPGDTLFLQSATYSWHFVEYGRGN